MVRTLYGKRKKYPYYLRTESGRRSGTFKTKKAASGVKLSFERLHKSKARLIKR